MNHENLRLITTIDEAFGKDRTSDVGLESYRRFASSGGYEYSAEWGWHFYSFLGIRPNVEKEGDADDARRLSSLYKNYTFAADMVARTARKRCLILEHQGNVIHFFFPGKDYKIEDLRDFARRLTALVETYVLGYYEKEIIRFAMASQFGQSIIIHAPSPAGDDCAVSIVSLGPCANYPAKRMVERLTNYECPWSWWNGVKWVTEECHVADDESRIIRESYVNDELHSKFDKVMGPGVELADERSGAEEKLSIVHDANNFGGRRESFFFRADMDGFTRKVDEAFKNNKTRELVLEFIRYMKLVEQWEVQSAFLRMIPHPWAGDCCNVEIVTRDTYNSMFSSLRGSEPLGIIRDWERYVKSNRFSSFEYRKDKKVKWTYSIGGGVIYDFIVKTKDRRFKLSVGRPVGRTHAGVNFKENHPEWLVMHTEDVNKLPLIEQKTFHAYEENRHPRFKHQDVTNRQKVDDEAANVAAIAAEPSGSLIKTRPWISEED